MSDLDEVINGEDSILPVLIVGAGPVGLVLSILLTKLGIKCVVLEKRKAFTNHPQAHFINYRSMEIFRKLDGLGADIQRAQPPVDSWRKFVYCTSLTGRVLGSVDHIQPQDLDGTESPECVGNLSQYILNRLLVQKLEKQGFQVQNSEDFENSVKFLVPPLNGHVLLMGHECTSIKSTNHGVTANVSFFNKQGKNIEKEINCKFLIGADGAKSIIRKHLNIEMTGQSNLQRFVSIHFFSQELGDYLIKKSPGMLFFIFNSQIVCTLIAYDLKTGEFVLQVSYFPPQQKLEDFTIETCEKLITKAVGRELTDMNIIAIKPWVVHCEVADKYMSSDHRVILAGDSAHRIPPFGGFGMNTGIQDAHNLAWKLASVLRGMAPVSFLSTYEMERKQIASSNAALSIQNIKIAMELTAALGLAPTITNAVYRGINSRIGSILPSGLRKAFLDGVFGISALQLSGFLLNEKNPLGSSRLAKLKQMLEYEESLQLIFPAEDLGFRYLKGALVSDGDNIFDPLAAPTGRRRDYVPSTDPGSRLPHMNIRLSSNLSNKNTFSTLDLVSVEKVEFLLVIAPVKESYSLAQAAFKVAEEIKVPVKVCVVWPENTMDGNLTSDAALTPRKNFIDVVEVKRLPTSPSWWNLCQMTDHGAILVRPDEHVAWRSKSGNISDPLSEMKQVFSMIFRSEATSA